MSRHGENKEVGWLRQQLAAMTAERDRLKQHLEAREELDAILMAEALPQAADGTGPIARVPGPRAGGHRVPKEARWLRVVPGFVLAGGAAFRAAWTAHAPAAAKTALSWSVTHPFASAVAGAGTAAVLVTGAVVVAPHSLHAIGAGGGTVPNPAASIYSATPITSPPPIDSLVTRTKSGSRLDAKAAGAVQPAPWYVYDPSPSSVPSQSSPSSQQSQVSVQAPAVQAVLEPVTGTLDLTSGVAQVITVSAGGNSGWVAWHIDAGGTDLDFAPDHGVLQAGQSATVTVSVDPAQALDGNLLQTFTVNGQQVAVTLPPLPVTVPSVMPSVVPSVPDPLAS